MKQAFGLVVESAKLVTNCEQIIYNTLRMPSQALHPLKFAYFTLSYGICHRRFLMRANDLRHIVFPQLTLASFCLIRAAESAKVPLVNAIVVFASDVN